MNLLKFNSGAKAGNVNYEVVTPTGFGFYKILYGQVALTTDATVANRRVIIAVYDDTSPTPVLQFDIHAGAVVTASLTDQHHELMPGIYRETAFVGDALQVSIPRKFIVPGGWKIRVSISAGVAGDSYTANLLIEEQGSR